MGRADDPSEVDFPAVDFVVSGTDPDADEELQLPEVREWPWLRRARVPLAVAAVIAIVVAAVVTVDHGAADRRPVAAAPSSPSRPITPPSSTAPAGRPRFFPIELVLSGPDFSAGDVRRAEHCPRTVSCDASSRVPSGLRAALRRHFPHVRAIRAVGVLAHRDAPGSMLWARHVTARSGRVTLAVLVRRATKRDFAIAATSFGGLSGSNAVLARSGGLIVEVDATGRRAELPPLAQLRRLARDRGLLVLD